VFNLLVQALKTLFLYTQSDKENMEQYRRNFRTFGDTVEAFRGSLGAQKGLINVLLKDPLRVRSSGSPTDAKRKNAEEEANESIKAVLLSSGAIKNRFDKLKDKLANNYDTYKKAMWAWKLPSHEV
jgi:hypothetical protein